MLEERSSEKEYLDDESFDPRLARRSYELMRWVNRFLGGEHIVRRFVAGEARRTPRRPLRVLDMGAGACDIPLAVSRWAREHGLAVEFDCVDLSPRAEEIALSAIRQAGDDRVRFIRADIFAHRPSEAYDCAVGSLFFHHLGDQEILGLMTHLRSIVRRCVLINDLRRSSPHLAGGYALTSVVEGPIRHDAVVSIRRSFRAKQLRRLLEQLPDVDVEVADAWLFRVQAVVRFRGGQ